MKILTRKATAKHFNQKWWTNEQIISRYINVINDLEGALNNSKKEITTRPAIFNRAYLTCEYIINNLKKESRILEMACGLGFVTHTLNKKKYNVRAFDISKDAINSAKNVAKNMKQDKNIFFVADENYLKSIESNSLDAIIGLGYFRYIDFNKQKKVYRECRRILNRNGVLILDHQNELYEMFALNNESIEYWANFIENYCDIGKIYKKGTLIKKLNSHIITPIRNREAHSISTKTKVFSENPIIYKDKCNDMGFVLEEIVYPHTEIIPPFLHGEINIDSLNELQRQNCLKLSKNWKSMFMCYQFLSFLRPIK